MLFGFSNVHFLRIVFQTLSTKNSILYTHFTNEFTTTRRRESREIFAAVVYKGFLFFVKRVIKRALLLSFPYSLSFGFENSLPFI